MIRCVSRGMKLATVSRAVPAPRAKIAEAPSTTNIPISSKLSLERSIASTASAGVEKRTSASVPPSPATQPPSSAAILRSSPCLAGQGRVLSVLRHRRWGQGRGLDCPPHPHLLPLFVLPLTGLKWRGHMPPVSLHRALHGRVHSHRAAIQGSPPPG